VIVQSSFMRILAIADIHGYHGASYFLEELGGLYDFDAIMIAGDLTNFGPAEYARELIDSLSGDIFAVPGNCDPVDVISAIEKSKGWNVHRKIVNYRGYRIAGLGGTNGRGFTMGITFDEKEAYKFLRECNGCIVLLHQPPFGILDKVGNRHIGSKGIRRALDEAKPLLVISGHVHEARGYEIRDNTIFVNPGPLKEGYASLIDLERKEVKMIEK